MKVTGLALLLAAPAWCHPGAAGSVHGDVERVPATERPPGETRVAMRVEGDRRIIESNGLPDHPTGRFPNRGNPHRILGQRHRFTVPARPEPATVATKLDRQPFGVALNGVLFAPNTAEFHGNRRDSGWNYEALGGKLRLGLDENHAHVQPNGAYHYHGLPTALFGRLSGGAKRMTLLGWAADGFPIYGLYGYKDPGDPASGVVELRSSFRLRSGRRPEGDGQPGGAYDGSFTSDYEYAAGLGDLDECNGRHGVTPEFPQGTYHYVLTADYPFVPRAFRGTPDPSFARRGPRGDASPAGRAHPPGTPAPQRRPPPPLPPDPPPGP